MKHKRTLLGAYLPFLEAPSKTGQSKLFCAFYSSVWRRHTQGRVNRDASAPPKRHLRTARGLSDVWRQGGSAKGRHLCQCRSTFFYKPMLNEDLMDTG